MVVGLQIKYDFRKHFPWILCGLAHHCINKAREFGRIVLAMWEQLSDEAQALQHAITKLLLTGIIGEQLHQFAVQLVALSALPQLEFEIASLSFISIVGHWLTL